MDIATLERIGACEDGREWAAKQTTPGEIKRSVQLLERINPKAIGFVVTRLENFKGGGYYSSITKVDPPPQPAGANLFATYFKKKNEL